MFHFVAIAYVNARKGEPDRVGALNALGRHATWLFLEAQRAGQQALLDATDVLRESFTFPSDDVRQAHLGYLLALLRTPGPINARLDAAATAERLSVATSLDPEIERKELEPLVEAYREVTKAGDQAATTRATTAIDAILRRELFRRLELVSQARDVVRADPREPNSGLATLRKSAAYQYQGYMRREEQLVSGTGRPFVPSPITDFDPTAAARNFRVLESSERARMVALIHHDQEMLDEAVASGDAFVGRLSEVRDEGQGRKTTPVWEIETAGSGPLRLREGGEVCVAGLPRRMGRIRSIDLTRAGRVIEVEITGLKTVPRKPVDGEVVLPATDPGLEGAEITMLAAGPDPVVLMMRSHAFDGDGPGSWLTHSRPGEAGKGQMEEEPA